MRQRTRRTPALVLNAQAAPLSAEELSRVGRVLREGGLVAFPTDTVYGVAANATLPSAVNRLFRAKGRSAEKALPLLVADAEEAPRYAAELPPAMRALMDRFWPGPLTLVVRRTDAVCPETVGGGDTVALRMPDHALAREIIRRAGVPVAVTSANRSGRPSATEASPVLAELGDRLDVIVDGGPSGSGLPSTVVDVTAAPPRVLRLGGVTREDLERVFAEVLEASPPEHRPEGASA